jgi:hypothetical protein
MTSNTLGCINQVSFALLKPPDDQSISIHGNIKPYCPRHEYPFAAQVTYRMIVEECGE